jgi:predicted nucleic acid-binding protein
MIVLDTSVLVDLLRDHDAASEAFGRSVRSGERFAASVLVKVEVLAGMRPSEEQHTRRWFRRIEWIGVDDDIAERAGQLANRYLRSHRGIDPVDYVIAATAERLGATLWTRNVRHFPMFPDLEAPY